jgi:nucleoside 2-deoxyribosyltransferase
MIKKVENLLIERGIDCCAPYPFKFRDQKHPSYFENGWDALSNSEKLNESKQAEQGYLKKIDEADVLYVVNPSGYVGSSVVFEMGYAFAKGKAVYSLEPIGDFAVMSLVQRTISPEDLVKILRKECALRREF